MRKRMGVSLVFCCLAKRVQSHTGGLSSWFCSTDLFGWLVLKPSSFTHSLHLGIQSAGGGWAMESCFPCIVGFVLQLCHCFMYGLVVLQGWELYLYYRDNGPSFGCMGEG